MDIDKSVIKKISAGILIPGIWEIATRFGALPSYILPSFSKVMVTLWSELVHGELLIMTGRSLFVLAEALLLNITLAIVIVFLCQCSMTFCSLYGVIAAIMNAIPNMALLPLVIMWFGIGDSAVFALITHSVIWTFTIYVNDGLNTIPQIYIDIADNMELDIASKIIGIYIPAVFPNIISGIKVAWGRAWRSLIGAEIVFGVIGSNGGLGYYININRLSGNMSKVLAGVMVIAIIGLVVDYGLFNRLYFIINKWGVNSERYIAKSR